MTFEIQSTLRDDKCYANGKLIATFDRRKKLLIFHTFNNSFVLNQKEVHELACWLISIEDFEV